MEENEKEIIQLPENAFTELKDGEQYEPVMNPKREYPEVNAWSVTWGIVINCHHRCGRVYGCEAQQGSRRECHHPEYWRLLWNHSCGCHLHAPCHLHSAG